MYSKTCSKETMLELLRAEVVVVVFFWESFFCLQTFNSGKRREVFRRWGENYRLFFVKRKFTKSNRTRKKVSRSHNQMEIMICFFVSFLFFLSFYKKRAKKNCQLVFFFPSSSSSSSPLLCNFSYIYFNIFFPSIYKRINNSAFFFFF